MKSSLSPFDILDRVVPDPNFILRENRPGFCCFLSSRFSDINRDGLFRFKKLVIADSGQGRGFEDFWHARSNQLLDTVLHALLELREHGEKFTYFRLSRALTLEGLVSLSHSHILSTSSISSLRLYFDSLPGGFGSEEATRQHGYVSFIASVCILKMNLCLKSRFELALSSFCKTDEGLQYLIDENERDNHMDYWMLMGMMERHGVSKGRFMELSGSKTRGQFLSEDLGL